jgi:hypothetical protein
LRRLQAWAFVAAACLLGPACHEIVGIKDRRIGGNPGSGGALGLDGSVAIDTGSGGSTGYDGAAPWVDAPAIGIDGGRDAGPRQTGGFATTGGTPGTAGFTGAGGLGGSGGVSGHGGSHATGGHQNPGGTTGAGGLTATGGTGIAATGGRLTDGGAAADAATADASAGADGSATGGVTASGGNGAGGSGTGGNGTGGNGAGGSGTGGNGTGGNGAGGNGTGGNGTGGAPGTGGTTSAGCGDGVKAPAEQCDLADLGGKTCAAIGLGSAGTLRCAADCTLDTSACRPILVMFGGSPNGGYSTLLGDTWEYANGQWSERTPVNRPGERYAVGMAALDGKVVLFGGYGYTTPEGTSKSYRNDTWVWDGSDWTLMPTSRQPSARYSPAMGTLRGRVVLFGGYGGSAYGDTWEWDGTQWTQRSPAHSPSARDGTAMANVGGERLILFGAGTETWEWDGQDWTLLAPATAPSDRKYLKAATLNGGIVLYGGATSNSSSAIFYSDTWRWSGGTWTRLLELGPPTACRSFAIGPLGGSVLLFGGLGSDTTYADTWEWTGTTWATRPLGPSPRMDVTLAAR